MINSQWRELPISPINFHDPKDVRATEIRLCIILCLKHILTVSRLLGLQCMCTSAQGYIGLCGGYNLCIFTNLPQKYGHRFQMVCFSLVTGLLTARGLPNCSKAQPNCLHTSRKHAYIGLTPLNPTFIQ